jgi:peptide-methionine (S)-S-oxide reductase
MTKSVPLFRFVRTACAAVVIAACGALFTPPADAEQAMTIPPPGVDATDGEGLQTAVLAGGCFWGVQAVFQHTNGVTKAVSGYSGGSKETAQYETVSSGRTGHAEAVEVTFDPKRVSYGKILQIFFSVVHDPTQLNRQGPDVGPQYRSAIFAATPEQQRIAEAYVAQLAKAGVYKRPIVTRIGALDAFYPAEDYHQDYATLHPMQPYIYINDRPKVENLKRLFVDVYRDKPVLLRAVVN